VQQATEQNTVMTLYLCANYGGRAEPAAWDVPGSLLTVGDVTCTARLLASAGRGGTWQRGTWPRGTWQRGAWPRENDLLQLIGRPAQLPQVVRNRS
jgi:hypothetical protein